MKYRAAVFDLDGTLIDSIEDIADSMNAVLLSNGLPVHEVDVYRSLVGDGSLMLAKRALPENAADEEKAEETRDLFFEEYRARCMEKTRPYPGIPGLLDMLAGRGIRLAVLSNKFDELTVMLVRSFFPEHDFECVVGSRPGIPRKPSPDGAFLIAGEMGVKPAEFIYFGDTGTDMETAVRAGMFPVGVLWGFRDRNELVSAGASAVIERPEDFISAGIC